jgi:hypothetical protein
MKPQDTVIFLLGELKGGVSSLKESVDSSAASQATINTANETEHAKFRETLGIHATAIAVMQDGQKVKQENKLTRLQAVALWAGAPAAVASAIGLLAYINLNH